MFSEKIKIDNSEKIDTIDDVYILETIFKDYQDDGIKETLVFENDDIIGNEIW